MSNLFDEFIIAVLEALCEASFGLVDGSDLVYGVFNSAVFCGKMGRIDLVDGRHDFTDVCFICWYAVLGKQASICRLVLFVFRCAVVRVVSEQCMEEGKILPGEYGIAILVHIERVGVLRDVCLNLDAHVLYLPSFNSWYA